MNLVVVFLLPSDASRQDFETALRESLDSLATPEAPRPDYPDELGPPAVREPAMWTWFVPNARPRMF